MLISLYEHVCIYITTCFLLLFLMKRRPPRSTLTDTLFPYTTLFRSEEALATLSCVKILPRPQPQMLIGGLGMGFTLRAALASLGSDASITVAELVPAVVSWAQGPMAHIFGESLSEDRKSTRLNSSH